MKKPRQPLRYVLCAAAACVLAALLLPLMGYADGRDHDDRPASYTATVYYMLDDGATQVAQPYKQEVQANEPCTVVSPDLDGLVTDQKQVTLTAEHPTATVVYRRVAECVANYEVRHVRKPPCDSSAESVIEIEICTGVVGQLTQATARTYTGFTACLPIENVCLKKEGTVVEIVYTRNSYRLDYDTQGGNLMDSVWLQYGQALPMVSAPTRAGYTFLGWTYSDSEAQAGTMPAANVTATALWQADEPTPTPTPTPTPVCPDTPCDSETEVAEVPSDTVSAADTACSADTAQSECPRAPITGLP